MKFIITSLFLLLSCLANAFETGGVIYNSTTTSEQVIALGIRPEGHMGAPSPHNIAQNAGYTGIAYKFPAGSKNRTGADAEGTWQDATTPGCLCEGWGAGARDSRGLQFHGRANESAGGVSNVTVKSFETSDTSLVSTVWINDSAGNPVLEVIHRFGPSALVPSTLFQGLITITNISGNTLQDVRYNRTMDWDIPPTEFSERVSIQGARASVTSSDTPRILYSGDNGFMTPNVWNSRWYYGRPLNADIVRYGPLDHGYVATFKLGDLVCGEAHTFMIYYGAGLNRAALETAFSTESVPLYSIGESNPSGRSYWGTPGPHDIAYGFGFKGVSGSAIAPSLPVKTATLPGGVDTDESIVQTYAPPAPVGTNLYQATFKYHLDKQWEGDILKYQLDAAGKILTGVPPLRAHQKLQDRLNSTTLHEPYDSGGRSIWTVGNDALCPGGALTKPTNNNNFSLTNSTQLEKLLFNCGTGTSPTANDVINFVRGQDVHWEGTGSTSDPRPYLLGDTFHSEIIHVGAPRAGYSAGTSFAKSEAGFRYQNGYGGFVTTNMSRAKRIYVGANDGMLHAFDEDLNETWAFIPPSVLPKLRNMLGTSGSSVGTGKSNSVFNVDGPITVKDVYIHAESQWKTVLMGGLGWGGKSYYALDVTDPDNPKHMFTINNDETAKTVQYWDADGTKTTYPYLTAPDHINYATLGGAWSRPVIMLLPYIDGLTIKQKWVAVFGAGYAGGSSSGYGPYVYVVDFEPTPLTTPATTGGQIIQTVQVTDDASSNVINGVTAHLSVITSDGTSLANYYGGIAYFTDLQGQLWKLDLNKSSLDDGNDKLFSLAKVFKTESTLANDRFGFNQVATSVATDGASSYVLNFFGTGDQTRIQRRISSINNRIFGIKDVDFPANGLAISGTDRTVSSASINDLNATACTSYLTKDWWSDIYSKSTLATSKSTDWQKVIGRAKFKNTSVVFSAYRPEDKSCPIFGTSQLIEIKLASSINCDVVETYAVGQGLITAPVIDGRGNIYIGVSNLPPSETVGGDGVDNITKIGTGGESSGGVKFKSWREIRY
jgi:type IV pilus assembly protein PilY1